MLAAGLLGGGFYLFNRAFRETGRREPSAREHHAIAGIGLILLGGYFLASVAYP